MNGLRVQTRTSAEKHGTTSATSRNRIEGADRYRTGGAATGHEFLVQTPLTSYQLRS